jgi:general stress protein 26
MSADTPRNLIWKYIRQIKTCMMVTRQDGALVARPMQCIPRPEQNAIWFFTEQRSEKAREVHDEPGTCLTFADVDGHVFVSVTGQITWVTETDTIKDLWNEGAAAFFPRGPEDPNVILLRFDPSSGEYWDMNVSTVAMAINFLAAKVTGSRPKPGHTGTAELSPGAGTQDYA